MATTDLYREFDHYGLDTRSSVTSRKPGFFEACNNIVPSINGGIIKRPGYKGVSSSVGGAGLFSYVRVDDNTEEALTLYQGKLYRAVATTALITYVGAGEAACSFYYDDDQAQYVFVLYVDDEEVANIDLGLGLDNEYSTPLSDLEDEIEDVTDFSVTITGDDTLPAALLFPLQQFTVLDTEGLTLTTYDWEVVNSSLTSPLAAHWATRNDNDFQRATAVDIVGNKYFAAWPDYPMKYDGQGFYRSGMPQSDPPIVDNVSASGAAEVTVVTCVGDDSGTPEVTQIQFVEPQNQWNNGDRNSAFVLYDSNNSSVEVTFQTIAAGSGSGLYDRTLVVVFANGDTNATVAGKAKLKIDADAAFVCTVLGDTITVTNVADGSATNTHIINGSGDEDQFAITTLTSGSGGLDGKYFILGGPNETIAFWYDVDNNGTTEPAHGATRGVEITTVTNGMTAPQVATATEVVIEADLFNSTASGAAITATSSTNGVRTDASAGTSGFGMSVTTQGANGGLGAGTYQYHTTYEQVDAIELVTEGMPSEDVSITLSSSEDATLVLSQIQPDSGFNTGCAIVNGNQANKNALTVDSGHTLNVGDWAFFKGQNQNAVKEVSTITTVADSGASLDGKWFYLFGQNGTSVEATAFWIDVDNNGTTEPSHGASHSVEVTGITTGMSANNVASQINTTINTTTRWTSTVLNNVVTVTDVAFGPRTDAYDGASGTGFSFAVTTQGSNFRTGENLLRTITATDSTHITVDGDPVTVLDNQPVSNGLKINIWRTETDGVAISKFLVDTIPNNSLAETATYTDSIDDDELGRPWEDPALDHGLPPPAHYISAWNNVPVLGGLADRNIVHYGIAGETSPEYFPPEANQILLTALYSDGVKGLYPFSEAFEVFKDKSYFTFTGDIYQDNVRVDQTLKTDLQFTSQHTFTDLKEKVLFLDKVGVFQMSPGESPIELSEIIKASFDLDSNASFLRANSALRRDLEHTYFYIPLETESEGGDRYALPTSTIFMLYNTTGQWTTWDAMNMAGGMIRLGDDYFFQEERFDSVTSSMRYHLYRVNREHLAYDYADGNEPITAFVRSARYGADTPEVYKKYTRIRVQSDPSQVTSDETIDVETHLGLTSAAPHSSFSLIPQTYGLTGLGQSSQRLKPTKATAMAITLSNSELHQNMALIGWSLEGAELNAEHMKE